MMRVELRSLTSIALSALAVAVPAAVRAYDGGCAALADTELDHVKIEAARLGAVPERNLAAALEAWVESGRALDAVLGTYRINGVTEGGSAWSVRSCVARRRRFEQGSELRVQALIRPRESASPSMACA